MSRLAFLETLRSKATPKSNAKRNWALGGIAVVAVGAAGFELFRRWRDVIIHKVATAEQDGATTIEEMHDAGLADPMTASGRWETASGKSPVVRTVDMTPPPASPEDV